MFLLQLFYVLRESVSGLLGAFQVDVVLIVWVFF
uniref:Uncharacterized protein n=1 Tax=Anguilla anguilla TaxID=7936 RepID=A0A0E9TEK1_ANGAN